MTRRCQIERSDNIMSDVKVPEGYKLTQLSHGGLYFCLERLGDGGGGMTIDCKRRGVRAGYNTTYGPVMEFEAPTGRGWPQKLVDFAVKQLEAVWEQPVLKPKVKRRG